MVYVYFIIPRKEINPSLIGPQFKQIKRDLSLFNHLKFSTSQNLKVLKKTFRKILPFNLINSFLVNNLPKFISWILEPFNENSTMLPNL